MSNALTEEFILNKSKCQSLNEIKNLNIWGCELEDVSVIGKCLCLEVITFSVNNIQTLLPFSFLPNLTELYLRKNNIQNLNEVKFLKLCNVLKILWLDDNPISTFTNYRKFVISELPQLYKLDNVIVLPSEREEPKTKENILQQFVNSSKNFRINSGKHLIEEAYINKGKVSSSSSSSSNFNLNKITTSIGNQTNSLDFKKEIISKKIQIPFHNNENYFKQEFLDLENFPQSYQSLNTKEECFQKILPEKILIEDSLEYKNTNTCLEKQDYLYFNCSNKNLFIVKAIKNLIEELNYTQLNYAKTIIDKRLNRTGKE